MFTKKIGIYSMILVSFLIKTSSCDDEVCDRRPLGTKTEPLPPDNRFVIDIDGIFDNLYVPKTKYTVRLQSRDPKSTFIAFTISLREDTVPNPNNPRRPISLKTGHLAMMPNSTNSQYSPTCNNTIVEADITPKTLVEVLWTAPDSGNKCVTIFAVVAIKSNIWYSFEGPLSRRVCEKN